MSFVYPIDICVGEPVNVTLQKNSLRDHTELVFPLFTYRDLAEFSKYLRDAKINGIKANKDAINDQSVAIIIARLSVASTDELHELLYNPFNRLWCLQKTFNKVQENKNKLKGKSLEDILLHTEIESISENILIASGFLEPVSVKQENPQMPKEQE